MNPDESNQQLEEAIDTVMQDLPPAIQDYITQAKYSAVAKSLIQKYTLHIDQGGILEREILLLLMGVNTPAEFTKTLFEEAHVSQSIVENIVRDINAQIFVPLRAEEMKSSAIKTTQPAKPPAPTSWGESAPLAPRPPQPMQAPVPSYARRPAMVIQPRGVMMPPPQSPSYFHLENKIAPPVVDVQKDIQNTTTPQKTIVPEVRPSPNPPVGGPNKVEPSTLSAAMPKLLADEKLLEDHEEPSIVFDKQAVPPNLPGIISDAHPSFNPPAGEPKVELPVQPKPAPIVPTRPYSVDPYREPIDEK